MIEYKEIPNSPGYLAGTDGHIYDKDMKQIKEYDKCGYREVMKKGVRSHRVHRLICSAFHGMFIGDKNTVNHKNGIRNDNRPENLERCTIGENARHSRDVLKKTAGYTGYTGKNHKNASLVAVYKDGIKLGEYRGSGEIARCLGISRWIANSCISGKTKKSGGYTFEIIKKRSNRDGKEYIREPEIEEEEYTLEDAIKKIMRRGVNVYKENHCTYKEGVEKSLEVLRKTKVEGKPLLSNKKE